MDVRLHGDRHICMLCASSQRPPHTSIHYMKRLCTVHVCASSRRPPHRRAKCVFTETATCVRPPSEVCVQIVYMCVFDETATYLSHVRLQRDRHMDPDVSPRYCPHLGCASSKRPPHVRLMPVSRETVTSIRPYVHDAFTPTCLSVSTRHSHTMRVFEETATCTRPRAQETCTLTLPSTPQGDVDTHRRNPTIASLGVFPTLQ